MPSGMRGPVEADETRMGGRRKNMSKAKRSGMAHSKSADKRKVRDEWAIHAPDAKPRNSAEKDCPSLSTFAHAQKRWTSKTPKPNDRNRLWNPPEQPNILNRESNRRKDPRQSNMY